VPDASGGRSRDRDPDRDAEPGSDPTALSVVAVTAEDAVAALEASRQGDGGLAFRVTPPFHGRQRARIHRPSDADAYGVRPVVVDPETLFVDPPAYPTADETAATDPGGADYDPDAHHDRHVAALDDWRATLRDCRADRIEVATPAGPHEVRVAWLG
jgi:hypothetical protein